MNISSLFDISDIIDESINNFSIHSNESIFNTTMDINQNISDKQRVLMIIVKKAEFFLEGIILPIFGFAGVLGKCSVLKQIVNMPKYRP